jgi:hypothetical protein
MVFRFVGRSMHESLQQAGLQHPTAVPVAAAAQLQAL